MTATTRPHDRVTAEMWVRRACTLVVAGVAAYASFQHQRDFALRDDADPTGATPATTASKTAWSPPTSRTTARSPRSPALPRTAAYLIQRGTEAREAHGTRKKALLAKLSQAVT